MRAGALPAAHEPSLTAAPERAAGTAAGAVALRGGYRLVRRLSESAVSTVWEAEKNGCRYALKYPRDGDASAASRARLEAEYRRARGFLHPCIASPIEWLDSGDAAAIVFEYLPGGDLAGLAGFGPDVWAGMLLDVLEALTHLHRLGFAHRDVKARNVMLDRADRPRLIDFGSCLPLGSQAGRGGTSAHWHSPETTRAVTANEDLYAYAALAHELLTGRPYAGRSSVPEGSALGAAIAGLLEAPAASAGEQLRLLAHVLKSQAGATRSP